MPPRRLPPLGSLPAFEAAVRLASMTRAAEELGRTHGAISRQIRTLEDSLRLRLLERGPGALRPTAAGAALFAAVTTAFTALEQATERLAPPAATQLRLACGSTFAARWLVPRLADFQAHHPALSISLVMTRQSFRDAEDFDLATSWDRLGYDPPKDCRVHVLGEARLAAVAAPGCPAGRDGTTLRLGTALTSETWPRAWERFAARAGLTLEMGREMRLPHLHHCIQAALAGLGATLVEERLVGEELAAGRLVALGPVLRFPDGFIAIEPPGSPPRAATRRLIAWLRERLSLQEPAGAV